MASSSSSAAATAAPLEVPPLPDKVYLPQRKAKGNIGVGKQYADDYNRACQDLFSRVQEHQHWKTKDGP